MILEDIYMKDRKQHEFIESFRALENSITIISNLAEYMIVKVDKLEKYSSGCERCNKLYYDERYNVELVESILFPMIKYSKELQDDLEHYLYIEDYNAE